MTFATSAMPAPLDSLSDLGYQGFFRNSLANLFQEVPTFGLVLFPCLESTKGHLGYLGTWVGGGLGVGYSTLRFPMRLLFEINITEETCFFCWNPV